MITTRRDKNGTHTRNANFPEQTPKNRCMATDVFNWLLLYTISVVFLILTGNSNLFPAVVLIGSFLVPVTYVTFFYERRHLSSLTLFTTAISFVYGGILGVLAASLLEPIFIRRVDFTSTIVMGLIEEFAKILGVFIIARKLRHDSEMDGLILGAAVGMGFAALESMGYAFLHFFPAEGVYLKLLE